MLVLVLLGYIDVVLMGLCEVWISDLFMLMICDGVLYGCGIVDMKGSVVVFVVVVE